MDLLPDSIQEGAGKALAEAAGADAKVILFGSY